MRIEKISSDQCSEVFNDLIENFHIETYEDVCTMCHKLRNFAVACISADELPNYPELDDVERQNLTHAAQLLDVCASLFIQSDPYYRSI